MKICAVYALYHTQYGTFRSSTFPHIFLYLSLSIPFRPNRLVIIDALVRYEEGFV